MAGRFILRLALLAIFLNSRHFVTAGSLENDLTNSLAAGLAP